MASDGPRGGATGGGGGRTIPLSLHRPIELVFGGILAILPLLAITTGAIALPTAAVLVSMVLGAALLTMALAGRREEEGVDASTHRLVDLLVAGVLLAAGAIFSLVSGLGIGLFFLLMGFAHGLLTLTTSYVLGEARVSSSKPAPPESESEDAGEDGPDNPRGGT